MTKVDCKWFFNDLQKARRRILIVDYDGTIAPFSIDRSQAVPYPAIPTLLEDIIKTCATRVIVVTDRSAHQVLPLLGLRLIPEVWGTYGLERLFPDGSYHGVEISDEAFVALAKAEIGLEEKGFEERIEATPGSVAIHWRGLSPTLALEIRAQAYAVFTPLATRTGLVVVELDSGIEIRLADASIGDAVRSLISELEPGTSIAYLGDDTSDENAFRVMNGHGLPVLVRSTPRFTAAQLWLQPPDDLIRFLQDWKSSCASSK